MSDTHMDQSRKDERLTATLPAWAWRRISFCLDSHIDYRWSVGHNQVANKYEGTRNMLLSQLGVSATGDLPILGDDDANG